MDMIVGQGVPEIRGFTDRHTNYFSNIDRLVKKWTKLECSSFIRWRNISYFVYFPVESLFRFGAGCLVGEGDAWEAMGIGDGGRVEGGLYVLLIFTSH